MPATTNEIAAEIERYCIAHPHARDTVDGISWWLPPPEAASERSQIAAAVEVLVARGVLHRHRMNDGTEVFGCGPD